MGDQRDEGSRESKNKQRKKGRRNMFENTTVSEKYVSRT
jgi:hypothetical protein